MPFRLSTYRKAKLHNPLLHQLLSSLENVSEGSRSRKLCTYLTFEIGMTAGNDSESLLRISTHVAIDLQAADSSKINLIQVQRKKEFQFGL